METRHIFATRLKQLREDAGLSQSDLAKKLNISRGSISFYENESRVPDIEVLLDICKYFHVCADYMLGKSENKAAENIAVGESLGLDDDSINMLKWLNPKSYKPSANPDALTADEYGKTALFPGAHSVLNKLLHNIGFWNVLSIIAKLDTLSKETASRPYDKEHDIGTAEEKDIEFMDSGNPSAPVMLLNAEECCNYTCFLIKKHFGEVVEKITAYAEVKKIQAQRRLDFEREMEVTRNGDHHKAR